LFSSLECLLDGKGNAEEALERLGSLLLDLSLVQASSAPARKVADSRRFHIYIRNNCEFIPNFGERYRKAEAISTVCKQLTFALLLKCLS